MESAQVAENLAKEVKPNEAAGDGVELRRKSRRLLDKSKGVSDEAETSVQSIDNSNREGKVADSTEAHHSAGTIGETVSGTKSSPDQDEEAADPDVSQKAVRERILAEKPKIDKKNRRISKAVFTADDIDEVMKTSGAAADSKAKKSSKTDNTEKKKADKERRGTFVVLKDSGKGTTTDEQKEILRETEEKNRRGTFVLPTAPAPVPKAKKTNSGIPVLGGKAKTTECKSREAPKRDKDRRGTYFVPEPVTPYLDVENIEDIEAGSLLVSLTDEDSQLSRVLGEEEPKLKVEEESASETLRGTGEHAAVASDPPLGECTILELQDMELTEPVIGTYSDFSALELNFSKKVSPEMLKPTSDDTKSFGQQTNPVSSKEVKAPENQKLPQAAKNKSKASSGKTSQEKDASREKQDTTMSDNRRTDKELPESQENRGATGLEERTVSESTHTSTGRRSKKFKLMKAGSDTLSDGEGMSSESSVSEVRISVAFVLFGRTL